MYRGRSPLLFLHFMMHKSCLLSLHTSILQINEILILLFLNNHSFKRIIVLFFFMCTRCKIFIDIDADTKLLKGVNMCMQKNIKSLPMICFVLITKNDSRYKQYIFIYVFKIIVEVLNHSFVQGLFSASLNHRL